jgi:hypothetical protein
MDELYLYFDNKKQSDDFFIYSSFFTINKEYYILKWYDKEITNLFKHCKEHHLNILLQRADGITLEEIGKKNNLTRERVRQIETRCLKIFRKEFPKNLWNYINKKFSNENILFIEDLPIQKLEYKLFLSYYFNKIKEKKFDKKLNAFSNKDYNTLLSEVSDLKPLLTKEELNLSDKLIEFFIKQNVIKRINHMFFINKFKSKREKIEFIISLFPEGLEIRKKVDLIKEKIKIFFPEYNLENDRNIIAPIDISDKVILWDWGVYIHIDNIKEIVNYAFEEILKYLHEILENNSPINLEVCFEEFKEELFMKKIYNKYALHSILKIKYPKEFTYLDSPWIARQGEETESLIKSLEKIFKENRLYSIKEISKILKIPELRVRALLDRSSNLIKVDDHNYKHLKYIYIDKELFIKIENFIEKKVEELEFIYVNLVIDKFNLTFKDKDTAIFIANYFKKQSNKFQISNKKFVKKNIKIKRYSFNFHYLIKEKILKNKEKIKINEVFNYFYVRGLRNENKFWLNYFYSSKKLVCRMNENEITFLEKIGINQKIIKKVNELVPLEEITIEEFINLLPPLKIEWNKFILGDILSTENEIFPNRNNPIWIKKK